MSDRNIAARSEHNYLNTKPSCSGSRRQSAALHSNECMTNVESVVLTQRWTVSNFDSLLKLSQPGSCLRSTVFKDDAVPEACWQLCLYPGGKREENANNVSLFLKMSATSPSKEVVLKAEYRFYFLDDNEEAKFSNVNVGEFHAKPPKGGHSWGLRNIPTAKVHNSIRQDKSLVISCHIELIPDVSKVPCKRVPIMPSIKMQFSQVPTSYVDRELEMLASGEGTDMTILAGPADGDRQSFRVHAYKLRAHSDVFQMMLSHLQMRESQEKKIEIQDFSPAAVRAMVEFIYAGVIKSEIDLYQAVDVMQIAEKYQILALKMTCEQHLLDRLNVGNVLECIAHAERHNTDVLYDACIDYAVHNRQVIMSLPSWRVFINEEPMLANNLLEKMVNANDVSPPTKKSRV
uniref:BTB domain-containing protein n=1 Tax=Caenorhabditis tropicalis TaxID=1561998 RepID=A0A1I7USY3_9PELO